MDPTLNDPPYNPLGTGDFFSMMGPDGTPNSLPGLGGAMVNDPHTVAAAMAKAGVPPPSLTSLGGVPGAGMVGDPNIPGVGASLEPPVPMPQPRPQGLAAPGAPLNILPSAAQGGAPAPAAVAVPPAAATKPPGSALLDTLRGIQAPKIPEPQKLVTQQGPRQTSPGKSGQLEALLAALNVGGQSAAKIPMGLGAALAPPRY